MKKIIICILFFLIGISSISFFKKSKSKVYDCFMFFNELDLLEVRLNELYDVVDYFVIVENNLTFSGKEKPLYFEENKYRFSNFRDKIIHVVGPNTYINGGFIREAAQRNDIMLGLKKAKDNDIIIISDLDEIPKRSTIAKIKKSLLKKKKSKKRRNKYVKLRQIHYLYYLNRLHSSPIWERAMATTYKQVKKYSPQRFKENIYNRWEIIDDAGWHFSFLGGIDKVITKLEAYSHQEFNTEYHKNPSKIREDMDNSKKVVIDNTYPKFILDSFEYFRRIGFIDE